MHFSPKAQAVSVALTAFLSSVSAAHANDAFDAESPWMLGDWNGQRTALQNQGYDFICSFWLDPKRTKRSRL